MPARFGVTLGVLSVYDWWFEFGLRRPDHVGSVIAVGSVDLVGRLAVLSWMVAWTVGQLRSLRPAPAARWVEGMTAPAGP
jgi:hypothetical protein